ncbi:MAG: O-antigen ligase family protein [Acidobacteria bacterium]|nr:O-antigen ligase family protein [Acidobacteriota bacterium]
MPSSSNKSSNSKKQKPVADKRSSIVQFAFLALPVMALIPNFFIVPALSYAGLATQEVVFSVAAVIFAVTGIFLILGHREVKPAMERSSLWMFVALAAFIIWQFISLAWAPSPYEGIRAAGLWLGFGIIFGAGFFVVDRRCAQWLQNLLNAMIIVLVASLLYERYQYGLNMFGIFFNHGISAELLTLLLPMSIVNYLCSEKRNTAIISFLVSAAGLVGILMGLRRGAILGTAGAFVIIALALGMKRLSLYNRNRLILVLVLAIAATSLIGIKYRSEIAVRIEGATKLEAAEGGLTTRLRGWITAWEMGIRHPVIGIGNGGYPSLYGSYRKYFVSNPKFAKVAESAGAEDFNEIRSPLVHNEYLQIFVELGLIGLALFIIFWSLVVLQLLKGFKRLNNYRVFGSLAGLVAFAISSFTSGFSFRYTPGILASICVLLIGFAFSRSESPEPSEIRDQIHFPWPAALAAVALILVCAIFVAGRSYNVYASQKIQGQEYASQEPLDFAFSPSSMADNERLERRYQEVLRLDPANAGAHLGYGLLLFQMKRPEAAARYVEFALKNGYGRPFTHVLLAFCLEQSGNLLRASDILAECAESFPQSIFVRASYAMILGKQGQMDQMRRQQEIAEQLNRRVARSWELLLTKKPQEAAVEAVNNRLIPPDKLEPTLATTLVAMRSYHYL